MAFQVDDTFSKELPADLITDNYIRQVTQACYSFVKPTPCSSPSLIHVSKKLQQDLGLSYKFVQSKEFLNLMSGNTLYEGTKPFAMCYGGHQFGSWAGQLGDGRAINLFETVVNGQRWALQIKGAGLTPYSRSADGLAVLRSSIREYLCSEAMFFLGVPTTRALSLVKTGDKVLRDVMYDGNPAYEQGAIVCRVAPSFIRFGNFQILAARKEIDHLKKLTDYTIRHFFPHLGSPGKETYLHFFKEVVDKTLEMVTHWQRVGFVHGVMNTDNMSILGLTIDYGPYGWLENYDPQWTPNTTDTQGKRYRFENQPNITFWNLYQLANALYPLIEEVKPLEDILQTMKEKFEVRYILMMKEKLGIQKSFPTEKILIKSLEDLLFQSEMDMTLFYRALCDFNPSDTSTFLQKLPHFSYAENFEPYVETWTDWLNDYRDCISDSTTEERVLNMKKVNPKYVLRNYMAQIAIEAAEKGDYSFIDELYTMLRHPYDDQPHYEHWFAKRPEWAKHKIGCSMLSCSS
ncbi:MAG: YdiU family protein [Saprospiraceae bacterium]